MRLNALKMRRARLERLCASSRHDYLRRKPHGFDLRLDLGGNELVDVVVQADYQIEQGPVSPTGLPDGDGGWDVHAVYMKRRRAWVDISCHFSQAQFDQVCGELYAGGEEYSFDNDDDHEEHCFF